MAKESKKLYDPKTAFGNEKLISTINKEKAEEREKLARAKCQYCDDAGRRDLECDQCSGRGTVEVKCDHTDEQEL